MLQDAVDAFTARGAPGGCLLVLGAVNCAAENKGMQRHLASLRRQTMERVTGRLKAAKQSGELAPDIAVEDLADYYTTVLHGLSLAARDGASRARLTGIVSLAMRAWPEARR